MSNAMRNSPYANAGIVAQVHPSDLADYQKHGVLAGLRFQQDVERMAHNGLFAPAQRLVDFVQARASASLPATSYLPGVASASLHDLLPPFISRSLQAAFVQFDKKMHGYLSAEAVILAVESRTSSPVRIPRRSDTLQHIQLARLYPCGEGAGYAGGITSSAIDGVNCAGKIVGEQ
jgi:uncharacterized FAD-dependent dehydrogenase